MIKEIINKIQIFDIKQLYVLKTKTRISILSGIVIVLIICSTVIYFTRNRVHDLPQILKNGRITVLTDSSSIGFSAKDGSVSGFQYEIIKAFADSLGVELVVSEENDLKNGINGLKNGDYDLVASLIPITTEWKKEISFSIPIQTSRQVLVQRQNKDSVQNKVIMRHLQLANDTIFIPENSPFKMRLQHLSDEIADPILIIELKGLSSEQMVHLVAKGKIKYTICDEYFALKLKKIYPNLDVSVPIGFAQQQAWVVNSKSKKLLEKLNEFLDDFIGSSAYWSIYRKYYN
jgi:membrane-bound lytic murein transglycosylase F